MSSTTLQQRPANQDVHPVRASRPLIYGTFLTMSIVAMVAVRHWYNDDAFIAFRMARNFADTGHWQYNIGVAGGDAATSPLWVLLCAGALKLHSNISVFATVTTVIFSTASAAFLYESLRSRGNARAGFCVGVLVAGAELLAVNRGMEIPLALALASASLWAVDQHKYVAAGVLLGLVMVARADMILYAGLVLLWVAIADRKTLWRILGGLAAVIAAWSAFALGVIGSIIPDTLTAKVDQGKSGYWGGHPYIHGITNIFALRPFGNGGLLDIAWFGVAFVFALIGLYSGLHDPEFRSLAILFSALGVIYVFAYGIVLNVPDYSWYYGVPAFCGLILAGIGLRRTTPQRPLCRYGSWRSGRCFCDDFSNFSSRPFRFATQATLLPFAGWTATFRRTSHWRRWKSDTSVGFPLIVRLSTTWDFSPPRPLRRLRSATCFGGPGPTNLTTGSSRGRR